MKMEMKFEVGQEVDLHVVMSEMWCRALVINWSDEGEYIIWVFPDPAQNIAGSMVVTQEQYLREKQKRGWVNKEKLKGYHWKNDIVIVYPKGELKAGDEANIDGEKFKVLEISSPDKTPKRILKVERI